MAWVLFVQVDTWRARGELRLAQQEIAKGRLAGAHRRLTGLAARPGALDGAADYWLGICEALGGRTEAALRAFSRVPEAHPFEPLGAYLEAKANLSRGRLSDAERRLEQALARGGPGRDQVRELLSHIYQIEVRFDDVKALHYASLVDAQDPTRDLKELANLDLQRLPHEGLKGALERAGQQAPDDDRVWLGKARLGIQYGRWEEAAAWLRRCREVRSDQTLWRAWLEWARGSGQPAEAMVAARQLGPDHLALEERLELRAWLEQQRGDSVAEISALEQWLEIEPAATRALERLAELAHRAAKPERVAELRRRKAEVERAMEAYRDRLWSNDPLATATDRASLARLAEAVGRPREARALYAWAIEVDPAEKSAIEGLARLETRDAESRATLASKVDHWPDPAPAPVAGARRATEHSEGLAFTDDAEAVGLVFVYDNAETPIRQLPEPFGGGLALLDYDGDGWLDVYCVQGGPFVPPSEQGRESAGSGDRLFHNRGDGSFEDMTQASGIGGFPTGHGHGIAVGDVDGDGRPDIFVTRWRSYALYRNRGDGTFEDITDSWGLSGRRDWPTSAVLADLDADGDLDLYVCHYAEWDLDHPRICIDPRTEAYLNCNPLDAKAIPDRLFRNDGNQFTDVTTEAGIVDRGGRGLGVVAADLDDDRRVDLFVANDSSANFLFRNLGGMRFEEVAHASGVAGNATGLYQAGMGVDAGDLDGDGLIDLVVTNFYGESSTFFRNLGGGLFTDATGPSGLAVASRRLLGFGIELLDANNDGYLDLASANGHVNDLRPNYPYRMPAQLLLGDANGRLTDFTDRAGAPWPVLRMGRGLAAGDLDNDGRQDVVILSHKQPLAYLHNQTRGGRFVTLGVAAGKGNRDCVGTKVELLANGRRQVAWRVAGGSYQSASDPRIHFGLGPADKIESLEVTVTWPSGRVDRYQDLAPDHGYLVREGQATLSPLEGFP